VSLRKTLLALVLVVASVLPSAAEVRIRADGGGRIGDYLDLFQRVRASGERVVIDGPCLSACTLVLSIVPKNRICVTQRAVLGFHAAYSKNWMGEEQTEHEATQAVMKFYPGPVRNWIRKRGGLNERTVLMRSSEIAAMGYRRCR
jgi:hypothetical protein